MSKNNTSGYYWFVTPGRLGLVQTPSHSCAGPLFQNEGRCLAFDIEIIFHSQANKTHFHKKGCAPSLIFKVRVLEPGSGLFGTQF